MTRDPRADELLREIEPWLRKWAVPAPGAKALATRIRAYLDEPQEPPEYVWRRVGETDLGTEDEVKFEWLPPHERAQIGPWEVVDD